MSANNKSKTFVENLGKGKSNINLQIRGVFVVDSFDRDSDRSHCLQCLDPRLCLCACGQNRDCMTYKLSGSAEDGRAEQFKRVFITVV